MSLADLLRGRMVRRTIVSEVDGILDDQRQARRERRRAKETQGIKDRWPEIPSSRLVRSRYWIDDRQTGNLHREFGGDPNYASQVSAYYLRDGWPTMLEPPFTGNAARRAGGHQGQPGSRAHVLSDRRGRLEGHEQRGACRPRVRVRNPVTTR